MLFNFTRVARHEQFHVVTRQLIAFATANEHFLEILAVNVADAALDQATFFINE